MRDELLREWIATHPGTRPWGWWKHEAPDARRRVTEGGEPIVFCLSFGLPESVYWPRGKSAEPLAYESQAAYLDRHGLLSARERSCLAIEAFEPEQVEGVAL